MIVNRKTIEQRITEITIYRYIKYREVGIVTICTIGHQHNYLQDWKFERTERCKHFISNAFIFRIGDRRWHIHSPSDNRRNCSPMGKLNDGNEIYIGSPRVRGTAFLHQDSHPPYSDSYAGLSYHNTDCMSEAKYHEVGARSCSCNARDPTMTSKRGNVI